MKKLLSILLIAVLAISLLPIASFAAEPVRYEAEDAVLRTENAPGGFNIRNASGDYADSVSGGKFVGGFDNWSDAITFTVNAENAGSYLMTIGYISMEPRAFDITVNGSFTENYAFTETGRSWDGDTKTYTMEIKLNKGENTIVFGRNGNAPSLDYIELAEITCAHPNTELVGVKEATFDAPGYTGDKVCKDCGMVIEQGTKTYVIPENRYEAEDAVITAGEVRQAYGDYQDAVSSGKFVGGFDGITDAVTFTVNADKAGKYILTIGYISMDQRSYDITVNGEKTEDYAITETGNAWEGDTKTYTMEITLVAGENTISFGQNDGKPVPNLDYIELDAVETSGGETGGETGDDVKPAPTGDLLPAVALLSVFALAGVAVATKKRTISQ